jgi:restriction system protein
MTTHQSPTPTADQGSDVFIPSYKDMLWETVQALRALGGSGHVAEVAEKTIEIGGYSEAQQSALMPNGRTTKLAYKVYWCLSALKAVGRTDNSTRGVWSLTDVGQQLSEADISALRDAITSYYRRANRKRRAQRDAAEPTAGVEETADDEQPGDDWKDELLGALRAMEPLAFERLCKRLLRESGFKRVAVTKASGDGGIDGMGLLEIGLLTFPTYFQCKRYSDSAGAGAVRDFRGAMAGRGEKGLIITTATFTSAAQAEATRDGVPPIDLIDGDRLCDLLKQVGLGVSVEMVERITVDAAALADGTAT